VIREVSAQLPSDFPEHVAEPIFTGLQAAAKNWKESKHDR